MILSALALSAAMSARVGDEPPASNVEPTAAQPAHRPGLGPAVLEMDRLAARTKALPVRTGPSGECAIALLAGPNPPSAKEEARPPATYSQADLSRWRQRIENLRDGAPADRPGAALDWWRIRQHAQAYLQHGEPLSAQELPQAGIRLRDAAFHQRVSPVPALGEKLRQELLAIATRPAQDIAARRCIRPKTGPTMDAHFADAAWFARVVLAYDYLRPDWPDAHERAQVERYLRRQAYFFAAQIGYGLGLLFPQRLAGRYTPAPDYAAGARTPAGMWLSRTADHEDHCALSTSNTSNTSGTGGSASAPSMPVYAYQDAATGRLGPRLSVLSQWYNNRKAITTLAFGLAGLVLEDDLLIAHAKRYFMEWLSYAVYPDGSEGEYARNGDYCIPRQGTIYGLSNLTAAMHFAHWLQRAGDDTLMNFSTTQGLFGTQSLRSQAPKSLRLVTQTYLDLVTLQRPWVMARGGRQSRPGDPADEHLGALEVRYLGGSPADAYHELGLLLDVDALPGAQGAVLRSQILRQGAYAGLRFPGTSGNPVMTGLGPAWSDTMNLLPAIFLLDR